MKTLIITIIFATNIVALAQAQTAINCVGVDRGTEFVPSPTFQSASNVSSLSKSENHFYTFSNPNTTSGKLYQRFDRQSIKGIDYIFKVTYSNLAIVKIEISSNNENRLYQQLINNGAFGKESPIIHCAKTSQTSTSYLGCLIRILGEE